MALQAPGTLSGPCLRPGPGRRVRDLVVLLHGYGANGADLMDLAAPLQTILPDAEVVAPDGPFPCEAGFGRQWFSLANRAMPALHAGAVAAAPLLDAFLQAELRRHSLDDTRLVLAGFSQGCMMALHVGLRRSVAPAAILGYSGVLVGAELLASEIRCRPPVLIVHGARDDIVPVGAADHTESALKLAGVPVRTLIRPILGHGIDEEGIAAGLAFLEEHRPV